MNLMYDYIKRSNQGESRRIEPCYYEVNPETIDKCKAFLYRVQKGLELSSRICFEDAVLKIQEHTQELKNGIYEIVYASQTGPTTNSWRAGTITKCTFFFYDAHKKKLIFCGFLRSRPTYGVPFKGTPGEVTKYVRVVHSSMDKRNESYQEVT